MKSEMFILVTFVLFLIGNIVNCYEFMEKFYNRINIDKMRNLTVVTDLPTTVQSSNRILIVIATPNLVHRGHVLSHLLSNYAEACEQGYEIHIVFSALSSLQVEHFYHNMLYYCVRLGSELPIAFVTVGDGFNNRLLAVHRYVFLVNPNNYDYFLNQEDDIAITVDNLNYYVKWSTFLGENDVFVPALKDYEILHSLVNVSTGFKYVPAIIGIEPFDILNICLLYTSDAADE